MRKRLLFLVAVTIFSLSAYSQNDDSAVKHMTLDDAVASAFSNNHAIAAQTHEISYNRHMKKAAWGYRLPQVQAVAAYIGMSNNVGEINFNDQKNSAVNNLANYLKSMGISVSQDVVNALLGLDLSYVIQKKNFAFGSVAAVWPIYMGGKINALNRASKVNISQAENDMDITKADLFTEVTERYWGLALSKNLAQVRKDVVECINSHYHDAQLLEKNGMISKTERMYAEMALSDAKAQLVQAENNVSTVNSALSGSTGQTGDLDPITSLFITDSIPSLEEFKHQVADQSLMLKKVANYKQLATENMKAKRADFFPTLSAMANAKIFDWQLFSQFPKYIYGATATLRIFDGLKTEQTYMASKEQLKKVEELEAKAEVDILILTEKIYYEMMGAREQVYAMESTIRFAEEYFRAKNAAFKEGMATSNDVVDAELNLSKCKIERMAEAYKFDVALSKLLSMTGSWDQYASYQLSGTEIK